MMEAGQSDYEHTGVIIVDHGSRLEASNHMFEQFVTGFRQTVSFRTVEPAHMELAEPSIATAFDRCVNKGARRIVVCPYFLLPGKHWQQDIPEITRKAAEKYPGVPFLIAAPIGLHPHMIDIVKSTIDHRLALDRLENQKVEELKSRKKSRMDNEHST